MSLSQTLKSIFDPDGLASGSDLTVKPVNVADPWQCEAQVSSDTSATGTVGTSIHPRNPSSTTSVTSMPSPGSEPMDWREALSGLRDEPLILELGAENYRKIAMLAEGSCETAPVVLSQIHEFFVVHGDERADLPLKDQVQFYLDNYWIE